MGLSCSEPGLEGSGNDRGNGRLRKGARRLSTDPQQGAQGAGPCHNYVQRWAGGGLGAAVLSSQGHQSWEGSPGTGQTPIVLSPTSEEGHDELQVTWQVALRLGAECLPGSPQHRLPRELLRTSAQQSQEPRLRFISLYQFLSLSW